MPLPPAKQRRYQRDWMRARREAWIASQGGGCRRCGRTVQLHVHHRDPAEKVSHRVWSWSDERRNAELAKCEVLCRYCHGLEHRDTRFRPAPEGQRVTGRRKVAKPQLHTHESTPNDLPDTCTAIA